MSRYINILLSMEIPGMVTEAVVSNPPTDGTVHVRVKQRHSEVTVQQNPLAFINIRINRVLRRTAPVQIVHVIVERRLLQIGEVSDVGVDRIVLGTGGNGIRGDINSY